MSIQTTTHATSQYWLIEYEIHPPAVIHRVATQGPNVFPDEDAVRHAIEEQHPEWIVRKIELRDTAKP